MEFSVCLDAVFRDRPVQDSLKAVHSAGIGSFEFWSWWDKDLKLIRAAKDELELQAAAMCTKFVSLVEPSERDVYLRGLRESIEAARFLGAPALITQTGNDTGLESEMQRKHLVDGLKACVPLLEEAGIMLLVEPLNVRFDHAGYFLSSSEEGFSIIKEVGSSNVKLLFDIYHQQITEGNLIPNITRNLELIGHFHIAGHPGRHEPYKGEIYYPEIFRAIDQAGYDGYVGLEYFPKDDQAAGLKTFLAWN